MIISIASTPNTTPTAPHPTPCLYVRMLYSRRLLDIVGCSTSSVARHRRLLDIVGSSTSSVTQHRRFLDVVGYSTSSVTQHVGYSTSSVTQHRQPCPQSK
jgi:hypothetical protein